MFWYIYDTYICCLVYLFAHCNLANGYVLIVIGKDNYVTVCKIQSELNEFLTFSERTKCYFQILDPIHGIFVCISPF